MFMATFVLYRGLYQMISLWRFFFVGLAFFAVTVIGRSRPSDKLGGAVSKKCFWPFGAQFGLKITQAPPLDPPLTVVGLGEKVIMSWCLHPLSSRALILLHRCGFGE